VTGALRCHVILTSPPTTDFTANDTRHLNEMNAVLDKESVTVDRCGHYHNRRLDRDAAMTAATNVHPHNLVSWYATGLQPVSYFSVPS
jgi:hypothetical protein